MTDDDPTVFLDGNADVLDRWSQPRVTSAEAIILQGGKTFTGLQAQYCAITIH